MITHSKSFIVVAGALALSVSAMAGCVTPATSEDTEGGALIGQEASALSSGCSFNFDFNTINYSVFANSHVIYVSGLFPASPSCTAADCAQIHGAVSDPNFPNLLSGGTCRVYLYSYGY